jgi:hypothetical protein
VRRWSKSGLQTYLGCSWRWYLTKGARLVDDHGSPATVAGTAYHTAIEKHERTRIAQLRDGAAVELPDLAGLQSYAREHLALEADLLPDDAWTVHATSLQALQADVDAALANWWEGIRPTLLRYRPVAVEPYFHVATVNRHRLHGFIDVLYWDPDGEEWVVVDHKTTASWRSWPPGGGGHELEAAVYVYGAMTAAGLPPVAKAPPRMEWHVARKTTGQRANFEATRIIVRRCTAGELSWMQDTVAYVEQRIAEEDYAPNPAWFLCSAKWCPAYEGCQVSGQLTPDHVRTGQGGSLPLIPAV